MWYTETDAVEPATQATPEQSFRRLVRARVLLGVWFTLLNLGSYMAFQLCISVAPEFLARPVFGLLSTSVGILWGTGQIVLAVVLIGVYLLITNTHIDRLERAARKVTERAH